MATKPHEPKHGGRMPAKVKRPIPSPMPLEARFVFDAAATVEIAAAAQPDDHAEAVLAKVAATQKATAQHEWLAATEVVPDEASQPDGHIEVDLPARETDPRYQAQTRPDATTYGERYDNAPRGYQPEADRHGSAEAALWSDPVSASADATGKTLYVIDGRVKDIESIVSRLPAGSYIIVDPNRDGVEQVTSFLSGRSGVSTLAFITEGGPGEIMLGESRLSADSIDSHGRSLAGWAAALSPDADILLFGCDVAHGTAGDAFLQKLADLTGADIAASTNKTGSAILGGDLDLEHEVGQVESASLDAAKALDDYAGVLALTSATITDISGGLTSAEVANGLRFTVTGSGGNQDGEIIRIEIYARSGSTLGALLFRQDITLASNNGNNWTNAPGVTSANPLGSTSSQSITIVVTQGKIQNGSFVAASGAQSFDTDYVVNTTPSAVADTGSAGENESKSFNVLSNDIDNDNGDTKTISSINSITVSSANSAINGLNASSAFSLTSNSSDNQIQFTPGTLFDALKPGETATIVVNYTMRDASGATSSATLTITVSGSNDAAAIGNPTNASVTEDQGVSGGNLAAAGTLSISDPDSTASFLTSVTSDAGNLGSLTLQTDGSYTYSVASSAVQHLSTGQTKVDSFTVTAADGTTKVITFTINGTNDAPVLDATKSSILTAVSQTATGTPSGAVGTTVSSLLIGAVTDTDGSSPGIAIIGLNSTNGTWWYSLDGSTGWTQVTAAGALSNGSALLLNPSSRLYFQPNGSYAGTISDGVTFRAWDRSSGTAGQRADVSTNGGSTPYSSSTDTAAITVKPSYSLSSSDGAFSTLLVGSRFDPSSDTQSNAADTDLYGQNGIPLLLGAYDSTSGQLYYRLRIDNPTMSKGTPVFTGVVLMGIDANNDGKIDIFIGIDGRNNGLGVVTYATGSGLNNSPSTTSITNQQSVSSTAGTGLATTGYYTYTSAGNDLGGDGKTDASLTFRIPFEILQARLLEQTGINITPGSTMSYVLVTLTQNNSINGDIGGVGRLTNAQKNMSYADLGILNPLSFDTPTLSGVSGSVGYTENATAVRLAPSATFQDLDSVNYAGGQLTVSLTNAQAGDQLSVSQTGGITVSSSTILYNGNQIGSYSTTGSSITLSFSGEFATKTAVQAAMQAIAYSNSSDAPAGNARTATFVLTDPDAHASTAQSVTINVTPVNDAPVIAGTTTARSVVNSNSYDIATAASSNALLLGPSISTGFSISDADAGTASVRATLSVSTGIIELYTGATSGTLVPGTTTQIISTAAGDVSITGSGTSTITLSGSVAAINQFLAGTTSVSLLYQPGSSATAGQTIAMTLAVNDLGNSGSGGALTSSAIVTNITITNSPKVTGTFVASVREDANPNPSNELTATGTVNASGTITGGYTVAFQGNDLGTSQSLGSLTFDGATWTYKVDNGDSRIQNLAPGEMIEETFKVTATIEGVQVVFYIRASISGVNDAPTLTVSTTSLNVAEQTTSTAPFSNAAISTVENYQQITEIKLQVSQLSTGDGLYTYTPGETEYLKIDGTMVQLLNGTSVRTSSGLTVSVNTAGTTATITITSAAGLSGSAAQAIINGITYTNTAEIVAQSTRTVRIVSIKDSGGTANGGSDTQTLNLESTLTLTPVNDAPELLTAPTTIGTGRGFVISSTHMLAVDLDDTTSELVYTLTSAPQHGVLQYSADGQTNWTTIAANGATFTQADINAGRVRYVAASGVANGTVETLSLSLSDGSLTTTNALAITITNSNQAPTPYDSLVSTNEDSTYVFTLADFLYNDADVSDTVGSIEIQGPPSAGTLQYLDNGVWTTITGAHTLTASQIANGNLRFVPAADANGTSYASFDFKIADGQNALSTTSAAMTINVTPVNDAPTLTATAANPTFTEGNGSSQGSAVTLFSGASVSAFESGQGIVGLILTVSDLRDSASENIIVDGTVISLTAGTSGTTAGGSGLSYSVSVTGSTATVTLTKASGAIVPASFGALIDGIAYRNSNVDNPTAGSRVVRLTSVTDSGGTANGGSDTTPLNIASTVTVAAVNDAPTLAAVTGGYTDTAGDDSFAALSGTLSGADSDNTSAQLSYGIVGGTDDGTTVTLTGTYGTLTVTKATGAYSFTPNDAAIEGRKTNVSQTFTITTSDGNSTGTASLTIDIVGANDMPTLSASVSSATLTDTAGSDSFTDVTGTLTGADRDNPETLTYALTGSTAQANSIGGVSYTHVLTGTYGTLYFNNTTLAYRFVANATAINALGAGQAPSPSFTFEVTDASNAKATATLAIGIAGANDTPDAVNDSVSTTANNAVTFGVLGNDTDPEGHTLTITAIEGQAISPGGSVNLPNGTVTLNADKTLSFTPANGFLGSVSFGYTVSDGNGGTDSATVTVAVSAGASPVNSAPASRTTLEDTPLTFTGGQAVTVADSDSGTLTTTLTVTNGTLSVTAAIGATITGNGTGSVEISGTAAQINAALAGLTYNPTANYSGGATLTILTSDGFNSDSDEVAITVTPVNDAPTLTATAANPTFTEGSGSSQGSAVSVFTGTSISTIEAGQTITSLTFKVGGLADGANERVTVDGSSFALTDGATGTTAANGFTYSVSLASGTATITLSKAAGVTGAAASTLVNGIQYQNTNIENPTAGSRVFTLTSVKDGGGTDNGGSDTTSLNIVSTVTVAALNDQPAITSNGGGTSAAVSVPENSTAVTTVTATDAEPGTLTFSITGGADQGKFAIDPTTGVLSFVTPPNHESPTDANGDNVYVVEVRVSDGAGGTVTQTINVTVTDVAEAPASTNDSVTTLEDTAVVLAASDFGTFSDPDAGAGFGGVRIMTLPTAGALEYHNGTAWVAVTINQDVSAAEIAAGKLRFVPAANANGSGYASIGFKVSDGALLGSAAYTLTVNVTAVNDAPSGSDKSITINEDGSHGFAAADFGFSDANDSPAHGFASVIITSVPGAGTLKLGAATVQAGDEIPVASLGQLVFTPAADANGTGYASIGFRVKDGGGTLNGGQDVSAVKTISFDVTPVADAPTIVGATHPSAVTEAADASAQNIAALTGTFTVSDADTGNALTASVTGNATATLNGGALPGGVDVSALIASGAISFNGPLTSNGGARSFTWTYDPAAADLDWLKPGETLTITYTARVGDGTTTVGSQSLVVTITGTNDAPVLTAPSAIALADTAGDDSHAGVTGTLSASDRDLGDSKSFSIGGTGASAAGTGPWTLAGTSYDVSRVGSYGTLYLNSATGQYRYEPSDAAIEGLTANATESFTFTVTDGANASDSKSLAINLTGANDPATIGGATTGAVVEAGGVANATPGTPTAAGTLTVADRDGAASFVAQSNVATAYGRFTLGADGGWTYTLDNGNAAVQALNGASAPLTDTITVTAADGTTSTVAITIAGANDAPTVANPIPDRSAPINTPFSHTVAASAFADVDNATLSYSATLADGSPLPAWLSFDAATRSFSGTPAASHVGSHGIRVTASDGSLSVSDSFTLTVGNAAPVANPDAGSAGENEGKSFDVLGNDTDTDAADTRTLVSIGTVAVTSGNAAINGIDATSALSIVDGQVKFTPGTLFDGLAAGQTATVTIPYTMRDTVGATSGATLTITVVGANDAPKAANDTITTSEDTPVTFDVRANDGDTDNDPLSVTAIDDKPISVGAPVAVTGGTVSLGADGRLTFTPAANFSGTPSFRYTVSDGNGGTATASVGLTVSPVDDGPTDLRLTGGAVPEGSPPGTLAGIVRVDDVDGGSHGFELIDSAGGRFTIDAQGRILVANGQLLDYEAARSHSVVIRLTAADGTVLTRTVVIGVLDVNEPSVARPDSYTIDQGAALSVAPGSGVLANDSDPEGAALAAQIVTGPSNGTLTLAADGGFVYRPNPGFSGTDSFTYRAADGSGSPGTAAVTIAVRAVPPPVTPTPPVVVVPPPPPVVPPSAPPVEVPPGPGQSFPVPVDTIGPATGGFAIVTDTASLIAANIAPLGFTLDLGGFRTAVISGADSALVLFRGVPDQEFQSGGAISFSVPADAFAHTKTDEVITLIATLLDGSPLPGWLSFSSQKGVFEGVPPKGFQGELLLKVVARDKQGREAAATFRVKVSEGEAATGRSQIGELKPKNAKAVGLSLGASRSLADLRGKAAALAARL